MGRKKPRHLTQEEQVLWNKVVGNDTPLDKPVLSEVFTPKKVEVQPHAPLDMFRVGQKAKTQTATTNLKPSIKDALSSDPVKMDKKSFSRMNKGRLMPEGKLDLHGMTLSQAHPALTSFILRSQSAGKRLVLVVTGKGKDKPSYDFMPVQRGILRHQVPQWLRMQPVASFVLQVSQAHIKHGGEGAYYVYLRRSR